MQRLATAAVVPQQVQASGRAFDFGTLRRSTRSHLVAGRGAELDLCFKAVDHEPQAAEATAQRPGRVEKTQVQAPRSAQRHCRLSVSEHGFGKISREIHRTPG